MTTSRTYKFNDALGRHLTKPFVQYINTLRNKLADINAQLDSPAALDQYPGRSVPYAFTRLYGPSGIVYPFVPYQEAPSALTADPSLYVLPRNGNVKVGRYGSFVWRETIITTYLSWTWRLPVEGLAANPPQLFASNGDIFDNVVENNGGALVMQNNRFTQSLNPDAPTPSQVRPNFCYEIGLYDKLRGRFLHDRDRLPFQLFAGQNFTSKQTGEAVRFDNNTEIEPRLYITQLDIINPGVPFRDLPSSVWVKGYTIVTFKGHLEQQEP